VPGEEILLMTMRIYFFRSLKSVVSFALLQDQQEKELKAAERQSRRMTRNRSSQGTLLAAHGQKSALFPRTHSLTKKSHENSKTLSDSSKKSFSASELQEAAKETQARQKEFEERILLSQSKAT
jgi:hypothetical protein